MNFFFFTDGWGRVGCQNILCSVLEMGKTTSFLHAGLKMVMSRFLHQLPWDSFCRLDAWTDQSVWRLT